MKTPLQQAVLGIAAVPILFAAAAWADSIVVDGQRLDDVYIREGHSLYYVLVPEDGTVLNVRKDTVSTSEVTLSGDETARQAVYDRWKAAQPSRAPVEPPEGPRIEARQPSVTREDSTPRLDTALPHATGPASSGNGPSSGYVPYVRLENVPLGDALRATLRSTGLDYSAEEKHLYVSSPERLRTEPGAPVEPRFYRVHSESGRALPRIVLRNSAAGAGGGTYGGGAETGYGNYGAYGGRNFGGNGGAGAGGFGGSFGNRGGYGAGGYGGGGYGRDVTAISNISDLFSNIDDRQIGEAPAQFPGIVAR